METTAHEKLKEYLSLVELYYAREPIIETLDKTLEQLIAEFKSKLLTACKQKEESQNRWEELMKVFSDCNWSYKPRDMSFDTPYTFKVVVHLKAPEVDANIRLIGTIVNISFIGNKIGYYYSDTDVSLNTAPINVAKKQRTFPVVELEFEPQLSYMPMNDWQRMRREEIEKIVNQFFPEFETFDNTFADYDVGPIQTELGYFLKIDLFQAIFGTHINGVI